MATKKKAVMAQRSLSDVLRAEDLVIERLIRLEERQASHVQTTKENFDETKYLIAEQHKQIEELTASLNKYKGFWGAVTLLASGITTALFFLKEWALAKLGVNT